MPKCEDPDAYQMPRRSGGSGIDFPAYFRDQGIQWGAGDLFVVGHRHSLMRIAELILIFTAARDGHNQLLFNKVLLIRPTDAVEVADKHKALQDEIADTARRWRGSAPTPEERTFIASRLNTANCPDLHIQSLVSLVGDTDPRTAVIVEDAARYRASEMVASATPDKSVVLPEDIWAPHLSSLCRSAIDAARRSESYVAVDACEEWPSRISNRELLLSIDGLAVISGQSRESPVSVISARMDDWKSQVSAGQVGSVLSDIGSLPDGFGSLKPLLRLQMLNMAGLHQLVLETLREQPGIFEDLEPPASLQLAKISHASNAPEIATKLLGQTKFEEFPQELLESAHSLATSLGNVDAATKCEAILGKRYPASVVLRQIRADELHSEGRYTDLAQILSVGSLETERNLSLLYRSLASELEAENPDYERLLAQAIRQFPDQREWVKRILAYDALRHGDPAMALRLAVPETDHSDVSREAILYMLYALERVVLTRDEEGEFGANLESVQSAISQIIHFLSRHPDDCEIRLRLADVVSAQSMGMLGLALLTFQLLELAKSPHELRTFQPLHQRATACTPQETLEFLKIALKWMESRSPVILGRITLPSDLLTLPADSLIAGVGHLLEHYEPLNSNTEVETFDKLLGAGLAVVPHGQNQDADLPMIRLAANRLALASRYQHARDYAELSLQLTNDSPQRARLAWLCFADVYERTGNTIEALVAVACALSASEEATPEQVWYESRLLYRLMRDLRMFGYALSFLEAGRSALRECGALQNYEHQIETLILQTRLLIILEDSAGTETSALHDFTHDVIINARMVLDTNDDPEPIAAVLGEVLRQSEIKNIPVPKETQELFDELVRKCTPTLVTFFQAIREVSPTAAQVLSVAHQLELARFPDHVAFDVRQLVIFAKRLLAGPQPSSDSLAAAFAIEIISDHAIAPLPNKESGPWLPGTIEGPGCTASETSRRSAVPLVLMGLDSEGLLLRVTANYELEPPVREPLEAFSRDRFSLWTEEYPFRYGIDTQTFNLFHTSTEGIGVSDLPPRAILIMSADLQQFPANLFRIGDDFAGSTHRLGVAPSLHWFASARKHQPIGDGRKLAWIPTAASAGGDVTLNMVAERLRGPLEEYGVTLEEGANLPSSFRGAELAIVVAHGSLVPGGRFFQVVQDGVELHASVSELGGVLAGVGVAVLFICSGGRLDKHPMANTTLGLARQLLGMGCAAVVASPWPLDARVPSHWLPTFMEGWNSGVAVIDAAFEANAQVRNGFSTEPRDCLAMHVYGDGLRTRTPV